jgi:hypothetical protein
MGNARRHDDSLMLRLPATLAAEIRRLAVQADRSVAAEIRQALAAHIRRHDAPGAA